MHNVTVVKPCIVPICMYEQSNDTVMLKVIFNGQIKYVKI